MLRFYVHMSASALLHGIPCVAYTRIRVFLLPQQSQSLDQHFLQKLIANEFLNIASICSSCLCAYVCVCV